MKPKHSKVYRIVDGEIETIKVLYETPIPNTEHSVWYSVKYEDGSEAQCHESTYPKTQSDAWQDWANEHTEAIVMLRARVQTDKETINRLNRELVGIE